MNLNYKIVLSIFVLCSFFASSYVQAQANEQEQSVVFPRDNVFIHTKKGEIVFDTEIASGNDMATGLMYRESLPEKSAMLFVMPYPHKVVMWMKNTKIPLDMLFMDNTGKIIHIDHDTKPMSLEHISAGNVDVAYVLEINAGIAKKYNINIGDKLSGKALER